jgi:DNA mismatch repair ATPase MutL
VNSRHLAKSSKAFFHDYIFSKRSYKSTFYSTVKNYLNKYKKPKKVWKNRKKLKQVEKNLNKYKNRKVGKKQKKSKQTEKSRKKTEKVEKTQKRSKQTEKSRKKQKKSKQTEKNKNKPKKSLLVQHETVDRRFWPLSLLPLGPLLPVLLFIRMYTNAFFTPAGSGPEKICIKLHSSISNARMQDALDEFLSRKKSKKATKKTEKSIKNQKKSKQTEKNRFLFGTDC